MLPPGDVFLSFCQRVVKDDTGSGAECDMLLDALKERNNMEGESSSATARNENSKVQNMVSKKIMTIRNKQLARGFCHPSMEVRKLFLSDIKKFDARWDPSEVVIVLQKMIAERKSAWFERNAACLSLGQIAQMRGGTTRKGILQWILKMLRSDSKMLGDGGHVALIKAMGTMLQSQHGTDHKKVNGNTMSRDDEVLLITTLDQSDFADQQERVLKALADINVRFSGDSKERLATRLLKDVLQRSMDNVVPDASSMLDNSLLLYCLNRAKAELERVRCKSSVGKLLEGNATKEQANCDMEDRSVLTRFLVDMFHDSNDARPNDSSYREISKKLVSYFCKKSGERSPMSKEAFQNVFCAQRQSFKVQTLPSLDLQIPGLDTREVSLSSLEETLAETFESNFEIKNRILNTEEKAEQVEQDSESELVEYVCARLWKGSNLISNYLAPSVFEEHEYQSVYALLLGRTLTGPWISWSPQTLVHLGQDDVDWADHVCNALQTKFLGRFLFSIALDRIRSIECDLMQGKHRHELEQKLQEWKTTNIQEEIEKNFLLKELRVGRREVSMAGEWTGHVSVIELPSTYSPECEIHTLISTIISKTQEILNKQNLRAESKSEALRHFNKSVRNLGMDMRFEWIVAAMCWSHATCGDEVMDQIESACNVLTRCACNKEANTKMVDAGVINCVINIMDKSKNHGLLYVLLGVLVNLGDTVNLRSALKQGGAVQQLEHLLFSRHDWKGERTPLGKPICGRGGFTATESVEHRIQLLLDKLKNVTSMGDKVTVIGASSQDGKVPAPEASGRGAPRSMAAGGAGKKVQTYDESSEDQENCEDEKAREDEDSDWSMPSVG